MESMEADVSDGFVEELDYPFNRFGLPVPSSPTKPWKTLRVSNSSHSLGPLSISRRKKFDLLSLGVRYLAPATRVAGFEVFFSGRFWVFPDTVFRWSAAVTVAVLSAIPIGAAQEATGPSVEAEADRILREMGEYLKTAEEFTFKAEVVYDEIVGEQKVLFGAAGQLSIRRPDRFNAEVDGDQQRRRVVFDGETVTVFDALKNVYAVVQASPEIDTALDRLYEVYGSSVPIADLFYADPYRTLIEHVESGFVVGKHSVNGTRCNHLAFMQEGIDWQIWIEDGPRPVPRRLVITYIDQPGEPQYFAELSHWNFQPRLSDHYFTFRPPIDSDEIEFLPPQERFESNREENP